MNGDRRLLLTVLVALVAVGCRAAPEPPDDASVRAELRPKFEQLFDELGLEPDLDEFPTGCPGGAGPNRPSVLVVVATAPGDRAALRGVAEAWGARDDENVRTRIDGCHLRARVIGGDTLEVTGRPGCGD